jgi:hypothetical protein
VLGALQRDLETAEPVAMTMSLAVILSSPTLTPPRSALPAAIDGDTAGFEQAFDALAAIDDCGLVSGRSPRPTDRPGRMRPCLA